MLSIAEIRTVQQMMTCLQAGEEAIQQRLAVIQPLLKESEQLMTLGTFYQMQVVILKNAANAYCS